MYCSLPFLQTALSLPTFPRILVNLCSAFLPCCPKWLCSRRSSVRLAFLVHFRNPVLAHSHSCTPSCGQEHSPTLPCMSMDPTFKLLETPNSSRLYDSASRSAGKYLPISFFQGLSQIFFLSLPTFFLSLSWIAGLYLVPHTICTRGEHLHAPGFSSISATELNCRWGSLLVGLTL